MEIQSPFFKTILRNVLARAYLNQEEMTNILCDAESVLSSRPLTYISEDPDELIALSPSVFLQEIREVGESYLDYIDLKKNEYLGQLKDFSKVRKVSLIKEGDIALVVDTNYKRINWPLEVGEPGNFPFPGEEPTPSVADGHSTRETPSVPDPVSTKTDHQDPLVRRSIPLCSDLKTYKNPNL
ncbi:integrase catalytic domain-containing protein [Trichonephila inaurata madagascariensis]|uniref:Integrase catalytic domain-containing protein n=1 Tax=Trichonephila inaurata madagascariensis TaxID=2747483 RepID=A0A8X6YFS9_9ARAC|nr:integrase catalytic domain-containing protein [Trichonephila inaurata madagascariensis]